MLSIIYKAFLAILAAGAMFAHGPQPVDSKVFPCDIFCKSGYTLKNVTISNYNLLKEIAPDLDILPYSLKCVPTTDSMKKGHVKSYDPANPCIL